MVVENLHDDIIVISGISGRFPNSNNVDELMENLINGVDCLSENHTRWPKEYKQVTHRIGTMKEIAKLDHIFFGISARLATSMDPATRLLTTSVFEAITDAGFNPSELRNTKVGVFASLSYQESDKSILYEKYEPHGFGMLGSARTMAANRISFTMDMLGPSCTIQSECVGSASALKKAFESIKCGECEAAIVDAGILALHPNISYQFKQLGLLSPDGINRSFDAKASGFSRSESIGVLFLQKAKNAKRIYAEISAINVEYGEYILDIPMMFSSAEFQAQIMKKTLKECNLKPSDITYIEADGTAVKKIDREELKAIDLVYGQDRSPSNPLLIGSVIIAMERDIIPPNLHYDEPPEDAKCLQDGRVKVVTEPTHWTEGYAAVNTASFNGVFSHIILKRHSKNKKEKLPMQDFPRLFTCSARNKEMLSLIFNSLKTNNADKELMQLINDIMMKPLNNSLYRGYILLPSTDLTRSEKVLEEITSIDETPRELWFVFSGIGSQWTGMGQSLMKIPIFAQAIKKCDEVLKPRGYDIMHIICDNDPTIYDNILNCFLGIAAIQIGLVDILYAVGVKPQYMIGHSVGEMGCSYADGCFTREEMILCALSRGLASVETELIDGAMAAVALGYQEIRNILPKDIDVACHNGPQSSTISGPSESVKTFVKELQSKGIFAKTVPTGNKAFHSRYISSVGPKMLNYLKKILSQPKERSKRWICTSLPKNEWHSPKARYSSPEYHTNNLVSPVLFEEVLHMISKNAITVEISPHGLLQAILAQSLNSNCINLSLTKRGHKDNAILLLSTLGKLYNLGIPLAIGNLYPRVSYPVSKGTPSISSLIRWEHSIDW
ncbi:fatty acid synthase-like [Polistes fuscatus]|uniref:fatty acid synthase-like n=1 Tax=Polistes fuscatus TaxID=30207 RepID=UPI001CA8841D|nr:fatty acid synthase-like [Polistes fuscatus]